MIAHPSKTGPMCKSRDVGLDNLSVPPAVPSAGNRQCRIRMPVACIQKVYPLYTQPAGGSSSWKRVTAST
ncbi:MAG: hypothetical protein ABFR82_10545 [Nitrospirota bacterium]